MGRISIDRIEAAKKAIDPVFLASPQYNCEPLSEILGVELILKIETSNPVRSFKGRGADLLVSQFPNDDKFLCASAGNFGQAMAYACRSRNKKLTIFAANTANPYKIERMRSLGAEVVLYGNDFDEAKEEAKRVAKGSNSRMVEDALAIETVEGAGTIGIELLASGPFDAVLVALGNGALFNGIATVFKARSPKTTMIAVQAAGAPSMAESWKLNNLVTYPAISTIADGIGVRLPIPEALADMRPITDDVITVEEDTIIKAMRLLHVHGGVVAEPSAVVGLAALMEDRQRFARMKVATIICGGNLTESQMKMWLL